MREEMILFGQGGNAIHPFPCSVRISYVEGTPDVPAYYAIVCDEQFIMAKYSQLVPAKMEINRLKEVFADRQATHTRVFEFLKDVKDK